MGRHVALLRAVNVGGRTLPMAELRALAREIGWADAETYIQSGNLVFSAEGPRGGIEGALERAIAERFGIDVPAIVRSAAEWRAYPRANPFAEETEKEPGRVMLVLSKQAPAEGAERAIEAKAAAGERVRRAGDALWIHYPEGAGRSKLTPALIDRAVSSPSTARNVRTVLALAERL